MKNKLWIWQKTDIISGFLIFSFAELVGQISSQGYQFHRILFIGFFGAFYYSWEVSSVFKWINFRFKETDKYFAINRALVSTIYYNPIWIFRHLLVINILEVKSLNDIEKLFAISIESFIYSLWLVLPANYLIQSKTKLEYRFIVASLFSLLMAVYYSLAEIIFN